MRLGLYHEPVHTDGRSFDTYGPYARYALEFARHFDHVTIFAPTTDQPTYFSGVPLDAPNVTVVPLPFFSTHRQAYRRAADIVRIFRSNSRDLDVIIARGTAPLAYALWWQTRRRGVPFIYHFASDPFEVIRNSPRYRGLRGLFAKVAYLCEFQIQKFIMRRNYSFTSGERLRERMARYTTNIESVVTSTLEEEDYHLREDCCCSETLRLLYVGYLREGKGIEFLLEAINILRNQGRNVELDLVGLGEYQGVLEEKVARLGITDHVHFHGFAVMGPKLNAYYNSADIFVLPSMSEGSPKVVLEALAHSLPVVATDVGSTARTLDAGRRGVLVPPRAPQALADGIARIIDDAGFRQQCIRSGYEFARKHSMKSFIERMATKARELADERKGSLR